MRAARRARDDRASKIRSNNFLKKRNRIELAAGIEGGIQDYDMDVLTVLSEEFLAALERMRADEEVFVLMGAQGKLQKLVNVFIVLNHENEPFFLLIHASPLKVRPRYSGFFRFCQRFERKMLSFSTEIRSSFFSRCSIFFSQIVSRSL